MGTIKTSKVNHIIDVLDKHRQEMEKDAVNFESGYFEGQAEAMRLAVRLLKELVDGITYDPDPAEEYVNEFKLKHDHSQNSKKSVF